MFDLPVAPAPVFARRRGRRGAPPNRPTRGPGPDDPAESVTTGPAHVGPLVSAGTILGVGLGGFVDGIVLHQLLQWHNMLSSKIPPVDLATMKTNMVWDGMFHALTWTATVAGLALLWRAGGRDDVPWIGKALVGGLLIGWGLFNFIEGVIDHHILQIHHVHPGQDELVWDLGFLASGLVLVAVGGLLARRAAKTAASGS